MNQGTDGAPYSAAYPVPPMGAQLPYPAPPVVVQSPYPAPPMGVQSPYPEPPYIPADEPVFGRMADIFTHPTDIPHYIAHLRGAKWSTIIWLVVGLGLLESVATAIGSSSSTGNIAGLGQFSPNGRSVLDALSRVSGSHGNLLTAVIGFFIVSGLYWILAKLLGGQGTFLQGAWLFALIWAPIATASTLLGFIPVLGLVAGLGLAVLQVVMTIFAMAAAHRLTVGKATVVVLIPVMFVAVATICAVGIIVATVAGSPWR